MVDEENTLTMTLRSLATENEVLKPEDWDAIVTEAEANCAPAQYIVGAAFEKIGDSVHARDWYQRSAKQQFPPALAKLREQNEAA